MSADERIPEALRLTPMTLPNLARVLCLPREYTRKTLWRLECEGLVRRCIVRGEIWAP